MKKKTYSYEIANVVKQFLTEDNWNFDFDEDSGIFDFSLRLRSKINKIQYYVDIKDDELVLYALSPVAAECDNPQMMANMAEFVCRTNYGLMNGGFEFDCRDGEIHYKSYIDCDQALPSTKVIKNSIYCCAAMFERYSAGITGIIFGNMSAKEAIEMCESRERTQRIVADREAEENEDTEDTFAHMIQQLAELYPDAAADES